MMGNPGQANYASSKAGLIGLTKTIAREVASRGVTVNAVAPGFIQTDMTAGMNEAALQKGLAAVPMGRIGKPEDVANAVSFLASDAASYITGCVLKVDAACTSERSAPGKAPLRRKTMNRVAITGLGVISPVGQDIETVYANLRDGVCGVGRITRFDPSETKISVAAEVKDFDPEAFGISRGDTRRMDLFYAVRHGRRAAGRGRQRHCRRRRPGAPRRLRGQRHRRHEHLRGRVQKTLRPRPQPHFALVHPHDDRQYRRGQHCHPLWLQGPSLPVVTACATSTNTSARPSTPSATAMPTPYSPAAAKRPSTPLAIAALPTARR